MRSRFVDDRRWFTEILIHFMVWIALADHCRGMLAGRWMRGHVGLCGGVEVGQLHLLAMSADGGAEIVINWIRGHRMASEGYPRVMTPIINGGYLPTTSERYRQESRK